MNDNIKAVISSTLEDTDIINVTYKTSHTFDNRPLVSVYIDAVCVAKHIPFSCLDRCVAMINDAIKDLHDEFPKLHLINKRNELHFLYPGFNQVSFFEGPYRISNKDISTESPKQRILKEKHELVGEKTLTEVLNRYPGYEIYLRTGFAFRGATEKPSSRDEVLRLIKEYIGADVKVIDDEIHVNMFSGNDMW